MQVFIDNCFYAQLTDADGKPVSDASGNFVFVNENDGSYAMVPPSCLPYVDGPAVVDTASSAGAMKRRRIVGEPSNIDDGEDVAVLPTQSPEPDPASIEVHVEDVVTEVTTAVDNTSSKPTRCIVTKKVSAMDGSKPSSAAVFPSDPAVSSLSSSLADKSAQTTTANALTAPVTSTSPQQEKLLMTTSHSKVFECMSDVNEEIARLESEQQVTFMTRSVSQGFDNEDVRVRVLGSSKQVLFEERHSVGNMELIKFTGEPFVVIGRKLLECTSGNPRSKSIESTTTSDHQNDSSAFKKVQLSRKSLCPAKIVVKELLYFSDYKINSNTKAKRSAISSKLRTAFVDNLEFTFNTKKRFVVHFMLDHGNHCVSESRRVTDRRVLTKMAELAMSGVRSVQEMQGHIQRYVVDDLFAGVEAPTTSDARYWPSSKVVLNCIYRAVTKTRMLKKDAVSLGGHIKQYLMLMNGQQGDPVVIRGLISGWLASSWRPDNLELVFGDQQLMFRVGKKIADDVQWEKDCDYVSATTREFNDWLTDQCRSDNPFQQYKQDTHWCYADYKHMSELFVDRPNVLKSVDWSMFGFPGRDGTQSTFWLGSSGAYTNCHYDSYGCNLVGQIYGRKRWIMFPPSQTESMYPTRIPYEESSVFSLINMPSPNMDHFPKLQCTTPVVVTLEPGDVLFVPRHWWHFVETLDTSISINSWIELNEDGHERVKEAIARTVTVGLMSEDAGVNISSWLNPTESPTEHDQNMHYLRTALKDFFDSRKKGTGENAAIVPLDRDEHVVGKETECKICKHYVRRLAKRSFCQGIFDDSCAGVNETDSLQCACTGRNGARLNLSTTSPEELTTADLLRVLLDPQVLDLCSRRLEETFVSGT